MSAKGSASRVVWVTGAGQGMGESHARRFGLQGACVACMDIDRDAAHRTASAIQEAGGGAVAIVCDVADWHSVADASDKARQACGPADVVVANAGILGTGTTVAETTIDDWNRVIAVNLNGVFHTVKAAIPQMQERGGVMVLVSSISGLRGYAGAAAYNASKHGVLGLMRTLANELARFGIRVNAVCPGWVDTPMFDAQVEAAGISRTDAVKRWSRDQLIERLVTPEEVSDAIEWLASPRSGMITGIALPVDGGMLERTVAADA
jgi:NAD(P)-dependent dehydrogenase (short-subunit alcohol dehydrogenase family)